MAVHSHGWLVFNFMNMTCKAWSFIKQDLRSPIKDKEQSNKGVASNKASPNVHNTQHTYIQSTDGQD
jgi:hypothetical protein